MLAQKLQQETFASVHLKELKAPSSVLTGVQPYSRALYYHAVQAVDAARERGWDRGGSLPDPVLASVTPDWQDRVRWALQQPRFDVADASDASDLKEIASSQADVGDDEST